MGLGQGRFWIRSIVVILIVALLVGQAASYALSPSAWHGFAGRLASILSMIAYWGPIVALIAALFVWAMLRLVVFNSLQEIRNESVEQNNPTPAIIFVGTMIASLLFLMIVIRP